jgi:GTP cyclohydrolase II
MPLQRTVRMVIMRVICRSQWQTPLALVFGRTTRKASSLLYRKQNECQSLDHAHGRGRRVDFDFPALGRLDRLRTSPPTTIVLQHAAENKGKLYDEFALVDATEDQFKENESLTLTPSKSPPPQRTTLQKTLHHSSRKYRNSHRQNPWPTLQPCVRPALCLCSAQQ